MQNEAQGISLDIWEKYKKNKAKPKCDKRLFTWGSSEQIISPTSLYCENENNPENSCDS